MFDKLIESDTAGADFKSRRRYFLISSVVVGVLFISAVVISLYATDVGLGNDKYDLTAMLAPVEPPPDAPQPPQPATPQRTTTQRTTDVPMRVVRQLPIDVPPPTIPPVSTVPNRYMSMPRGPFQLGPMDTTAPPSFNGVSDRPGTSSGGDEIRQSTAVDNTRDPKSEQPPPPARTRSIGVANGYATFLPKPPYPPPALAVNAQGKVDVQITIDEDGKVVSAKAVSGHPLLRLVSEEAALKARFKPTTLSNVPVKVTGVIVYNFTRN